jgi:hypothetical protein
MGELDVGAAGRVWVDRSCCRNEGKLLLEAVADGAGITAGAGAAIVDADGLKNISSAFGGDLGGDGGFRAATDHGGG